eukprot:351904-Chlamydomonas_euryale.AAC.4
MLAPALVPACPEPQVCHAPHDVLYAAPVVLNPLDADLDMEIRGGTLTGSAGSCVASKLSSDGCGYLWGGVRADAGLWRGGAAVFTATVLRALPVNVVSAGDLRTEHACRVGVSRAGTAVGQLGEVRTGPVGRFGWMDAA